MSLFNKPKRNIRRRLEDQDDLNENSAMETDHIHNIKEKSSRSKEKHKKQTLLSFGEELEEADDGEVFRVKKTSRSKKLMKQLDQERRKKKEEEKMRLTSQAHNNEPKNRDDLEIKTDDLVVKVKNSTNIQILNGRNALIAGKDDYSSEDEEDSTPAFSTKSQRETSKEESFAALLQSGRIPDAKMIHAARIKRQRARELGTDYIPIEEQQTEKNTSRLIREEDHDHSDENSQDRIDMTVDTDARDKERRRQVFLDSQISSKNSDEENENDIEQEEWEVQQIRKGVTGAQIASVQQDSMQFNSFGLGQNQLFASSGISFGPANTIPAPPPPPSIQPPDPSKTTPTSPDEILNRIRGRLMNLKDVHERHESNIQLVLQELKESKKELEIGKSRAPEIAERFKYFQELRSYVVDLVECFDEKFPKIVSLEQRWLSLYGDRSNELIERRRQDTRDQAEDITMHARPGPSNKRGPEEAARMRRATEREGRRARRRKNRELKPSLTKHMDGMSSDDEVTEQQNLIFKQTREEIENESRDIFEDVEDDFATISGILSKLDEWRKMDIDSYSEAFVPLCIPKMISPIIRLQLLTWNPLYENIDLDRMKWYSSLITYALNPLETEESLKRDPDVQLIPLTIEKVVIPKLIAIVEKMWDPMSTTQTLRLIGITNRFIRDYPTLNEKSKQLELLFNTIVEKIQSAIDNDVFIPIFPKQMLDPKHIFFQRQFTMAIKLLRNLLSLQGIIGDKKLKDIALSSLLNRYILAGLRIIPPSEALIKANMIMSTLPYVWLQGDSVEHLKMFTSLIQQFSEQLDQLNPAHNEAWEFSKTMLNKLKKMT